jgi:hypothetical protein
MNNLKIKIITGFREDQYYTIDAEEAHKAYYLFLNPQKRGIFSNGVAVIGQNIQGIEPDFIATMDWNKNYELTPFDWNEIRAKGIDRKLRDVLYQAKQIAQKGDIDELDKPMPLQLN